MACRSMEILARLHRIANGLEYGMSQSLARAELLALMTCEATAFFGLDVHVRQIMTLLDAPDCLMSDILEELRIMEEFLHSDEYGFREHLDEWYSF